MADVVQNITNSNIRQGGVVVLNDFCGNPTTNYLRPDAVKTTTVTELSGVEAKYTNRFDDPTYYSA